MAKLSKVDAAKAAGVSRQTLYTYINDSRLSVDADGLIDTAELLRAGFTLRTLHEIRRQDGEPIGQQLTSRLDALDVYQDMITLLKQQLSEAQAREQAALEREKIARDREALLLHMLQEMHQRTDRLLDIRRTPPPPYAPPARTSPAKPPGAARSPSTDTRGSMRQRIVTLLQEHPEGLTPAQIRDQLGVQRPLGDTLLGMLRYGLVERVGRGRYVAAAPSTNDRS